MNFIDYLIYTKNYSTLNSLNNYTKLFRATAPQVQAQVATQPTQRQAIIADQNRQLAQLSPVNRQAFIKRVEESANPNANWSSGSRKEVGGYLNRMRRTPDKDLQLQNRGWAIETALSRQKKADEIWDQRRKAAAAKAKAAQEAQQKAAENTQYQNNQDSMMAWASKNNIPEKYNNWQFLVKHQGQQVMRPDGSFFNVPYANQL